MTSYIYNTYLTIIITITTPKFCYLLHILPSPVLIGLYHNYFDTGHILKTVFSLIKYDMITNLQGVHVIVEVLKHHRIGLPQNAVPSEHCRLRSLHEFQTHVVRGVAGGVVHPAWEAKRMRG